MQKNTINQITQLNLYNEYIRRKYVIVLVTIVLMFFFALYSMSVGSIKISFSDIFKTLTGKGDALSNTTILNIRLPRVMAAILVGAALASAGVVMQCVLRNQLASASTLGVSQGAAFGAALGIVVFGGGVVNSANATSAITINNPYIVTLCAFVFGSISTLVVIIISRIKRDIGPAGLVLAGVALSSLFGGGSTLLQYFTDDTKLGAIVFWTFGNLGSANLRELLVLAIALGIALIYFMFNRWNYNAMQSGMDTAQSLGVNTRSVMLVSMAFCSLLSAVAVSFVGIISFVGLVAPHITRRLIGNDYRYLIPGSAFAGSLLLIFADIFGRTVVAPVILPIGALTSFLGAPMFLILLFKKGDKDAGS
ncbi:MAG: iron ABC transporter permease [Saccharofermentanales bacterium]